MTGDPKTYSKTRLVPLYFLSKPLTPAETRYWPTDMEMSGLVWATKKLRPVMERAHVTFVTDHRPNVDIWSMTNLSTSSTARSSLRLQTWAIYLAQFKDHMTVVYSKGSSLDCPDALSRLRYEVGERASKLRSDASTLGKEHEMTGFWVVLVVMVGP